MNFKPPWRSSRDSTGYQSSNLFARSASLPGSADRRLSEFEYPTNSRRCRMYTQRLFRWCSQYHAGADPDKGPAGPYPHFFHWCNCFSLIRVSDVAFSFRLVKSRLLMQDFFEIKAFLCHKSVKNNNFCHHMGSFELRMHQNPFAAPEPTAWGSLLNKRWFHHCLGP